MVEVADSIMATPPKAALDSTIATGFGSLAGTRPSILAFGLQTTGPSALVGGRQVSTPSSRIAKLKIFHLVPRETAPIGWLPHGDPASGKHP